MRFLVLIIAFVFSFASISFAKPLIWKTEKLLGELKPLPMECDPEKDDQCPDYVPFEQKSIYGVRYYQTFHEGTRAGIGFGTRPNESNQVMAYMLHPGAFDWGGEIEAGKFIPRYVVKRFYAYVDDDVESKWLEGKLQLTKTYLAVYRLMRNGASCLLVDRKRETSLNSDAHAWAEQDRKNVTCIEHPDS